MNIPKILKVIHIIKYYMGNSNSIQKWSDTLDNTQLHFLHFLVKGLELTEQHDSRQSNKICYLDLSGMLHISDTKDINPTFDDNCSYFSDIICIHLYSTDVKNIMSCIEHGQAQTNTILLYNIKSSTNWKYITFPTINSAEKFTYNFNNIHDSFITYNSNDNNHPEHSGNILKNILSIKKTIKSEYMSLLASQNTFDNI